MPKKKQDTTADLFSESGESLPPVVVPPLPEDWRNILQAEFGKPYFRELQQFVAQERQAHEVYPPAEDVYHAFQAAPYEQVRVVILGQDPYHDRNQAHGLCFSVRPGIEPPPSLKNIYRELHSDLGCPIRKHGFLESWARQGVMLLNTVLTVRAHEANSHQRKGWETFTDAVIQALSARARPVVFVLWGKPAQKKLKLIDTARHPVIQSTHPSPLSASSGFFGSRPFSQINNALQGLGQPEIDWCLPESV